MGKDLNLRWQEWRARKSWFINGGSCGKVDGWFCWSGTVQSKGKVKTVTRQTQQVASQGEETLLAVLISFTSIDIPNVEDEEVWRKTNTFPPARVKDWYSFGWTVIMVQ